jgi:2-(1,2-epoxy-1,2-dihydrophenyl)acetyl-CoA isomerase
MGNETVLMEVRDGVAHLTLNRPKAGNALDLDMAKALLASAERCNRDPAVRAVLITGSGSMFCAGGDVRGFASQGDQLPAFLTELTAALHAGVSLLSRMDPPVVAAVNGAAAGAGMSIACAADLIVAGESARFTVAYTAVGLTPDGSSTYFLPRLIGMQRAKELMLTNRRLSAEEALKWGLVNQVVPDDDLTITSEHLARKLAEGPTRAYGGVKKLLLTSATQDLESQLADEARGIIAIAETPDSKEGISAFLEKRSPKFTGA